MRGISETSSGESRNLDNNHNEKVSIDSGNLPVSSSQNSLKGNALGDSLQIPLSDDGAKSDVKLPAIVAVATASGDSKDAAAGAFALHLLKEREVRASVKRTFSDLTSSTIWAEEHELKAKLEDSRYDDHQSQETSASQKYQRRASMESGTDRLSKRLQVIPSKVAPRRGSIGCYYNHNNVGTDIAPSMPVRILSNDGETNEVADRRRGMLRTQRERSHDLTEMRLSVHSLYGDDKNNHKEQQPGVSQRRYLRRASLDLGELKVSENKHVTDDDHAREDQAVTTKRYQRRASMESGADCRSPQRQLLPHRVSLQRGDTALYYNGGKVGTDLVPCKPVRVQSTDGEMNDLPVKPLDRVTDHQRRRDRNLSSDHLHNLADSARDAWLCGGEEKSDPLKEKSGHLKEKSDHFKEKSDHFKEKSDHFKEKSNHSTEKSNQEQHTKRRYARRASVDLGELHLQETNHSFADEEHYRDGQPPAMATTRRYQRRASMESGTETRSKHLQGVPNRGVLQRGDAGYYYKAGTDLSPVKPVRAQSTDGEMNDGPATPLDNNQSKGLSRALDDLLRDLTAMRETVLELRAYGADDNKPGYCNERLADANKYGYFSERVVQPTRSSKQRSHRRASLDLGELKMREMEDGADDENPQEDPQDCEPPPPPPLVTARRYRRRASMESGTDPQRFHHQASRITLQRGSAGLYYNHGKAGSDIRPSKPVRIISKVAEMHDGGSKPERK